MDERCCLHYVCFTGQLLFLSEGSSWMNVVVCIMCVLQDNCCFCQRVVVG